jgi:copper chaperone NosL
VVRLRRLVLLAIIVLAPLWWYAGHASRRAEPQVPTEICFVAAPTPYDARSGVALDAPRAIPPGARCPVCGAFPSRVPDWAAQVIFADGDAYFFDSPLSLFIYLRNLPRYAAGRQATEIVASYVRAEGDGRWIAAPKAVYVWESDVPGPMRRGNLPAFLNDADARHFIARHGGAVVHPSSITAQLLRALEPPSPHGTADHT